MEQDALALPELLLRCRRLVQTLRLTRELQEATAATVAAAAAAAGAAQAAGASEAAAETVAAVGAATVKATAAVLSPTAAEAATPRPGSFGEVASAPPKKSEGKWKQGSAAPGVPCSPAPTRRDMRRWTVHERPYLFCAVTAPVCLCSFPSLPCARARGRGPLLDVECHEGVLPHHAFASTADSAAQCLYACALHRPPAPFCAWS